MPGRYLTVDELTSRAERLAAMQPDRVVLRRIGASRAGEPIRSLSVGRGSRHVLVVAGPHANEPVGGVTALRLARYLARAGRPDRFRYTADTTWHFLLCLDPDGARRNERWLRGPMTFVHHYRHFYRPGFAGQPEWLPAESGAAPMPETRALLELQDELRPFLQCSLHGVDVGGSFVQLTRGLPGMADKLVRSAGDLRIPVELGPYDAFFWPSPGPGVYDMPQPEETDQFDSLPASTAASTWFHPHRYGTFTAVVEAPMWGADEVGDTAAHPDPGAALETISRTLRKDALLLTELVERIRPALLDTATPLLAPVEEYLAVCPGLAEEWAPGTAGALPPLNRARVMSLRIAARRLVVRTAGLLSQLLAQDAPYVRRDLARVDAVRNTLDRFLAERCDAFEADCRVRWIPVHDQVEHQFRVVLAAAELAGRFSETKVVRA
ncbi:M14 family zinc carboxypeptidase [Streptomyces sp. AK02-01A]|uniref:M14 family zinc carboxypeptidase n=1 Tax=Streptomyces sp. AK02-01A TaxID=3028648 RepID=UPI0029BB9CF3|nr:M14 family zinc carboxypeptidase [Streptomyces sp. AK02-01A]MDX3853663.1 M14 family zinc carboxypeptidase [Streptomyces sp. AK02-01A]